jgi:glycosyl transferase family 25
MRLFAINLHRSRDRRASLLTWIARLGLPWEIFDAVDASALRPDAVPWTNDHWGEQLWPGPVGCFLSHWRVLQRVLDYGLDWAAIVEDDVQPVTDRAAALHELALPATFDLIYLHEMRQPFLRSAVISTEGALHRVNPAMLTTGAYIVSRHFAERFCAQFTRVEMPIDHFYRRESCAPEAQFFELIDPIFRIDGRFPSTIRTA